MVLVITGENLTIEDVERVARHNENVKLSPGAEERIRKCRRFLEEKMQDPDVTVYGVNTGIWDFSETRLNDEELNLFQRTLIYNHAAGIGDALSCDAVRAAMLGRINVHANGNSGCRLEVTAALVEMLNNGVTPFVSEKGSVGACGDLAPMSEIALLLLGEGRAFYEGELLEGKEAMEKAGITIPGLKARDGLAVINGCNVMTGMAALWLCDGFRLLRTAEIAAAMSMEALNANLGPLDAKLHKARGFNGAIESARMIRALVKGGALAEKKKKVRCQDAYSLRSTPQVIGSAHDAFIHAREQVEIELNGVGDNPVFFPDKGLIISGANFQGCPVSVPMDMAGYCLTMVCVLSERRLNRINNPTLSGGLNPFLATNPGIMSGMMLSQYTADTLIVEQRILSSPASIHSIPAAADQEDFVSMGMNTALKNLGILDSAYGIIGIEMMVATQALDMRENLDQGNYSYGHGVQAAREEVRRHVKYMDTDRPLNNDHNKMKKFIKDLHVLRAVEAVIGAEAVPLPGGGKLSSSGDAFKEWNERGVQMGSF